MCPVLLSANSQNLSHLSILSVLPHPHQTNFLLNFLTSSATGNSLGALRAHLGRSKPFDIRYVEIDNEDAATGAGTTYVYRWPAFHNALSLRFPNIIFIATTTKNMSSPPAIAQFGALKMRRSIVLKK
jgi:hypothetical protein